MAALDEPLGVNDDFDFDQSTMQAWGIFGSSLAEVISVIEDGEPMTISTDPDGEDEAPWLRFTALPRARREDIPQLFVEASSNSSLAEDYQLGLDKLDALAELGWQAPSMDDQAHPTLNFWVLRSQEESEQLAALAVATLREVFGVLHPVFLAPDHLAEVLTPAPEVLETPERHVVLAEHDAVATMPRNRAHLDDMVELELTHMFGHAPIRDAEGDIAIRVGSSVVFVRSAVDADEVLVFSPLVHEVEGRSRAVEVLNDLNADSRYGRFALVRDRVFASVSLLARPFVPAHLHEGVRIMSAIADAIDDELAAKLRGRVSFTDQP